MKNYLIATWVVLLTVMACTPKEGAKTSATPIPPENPNQYDDLGKPVMGDDEDEAVTEYTIMDAVDITPDASNLPDTLPTYNASHTFEFDLLHTRIDIGFDWEKKHAPAKAELTLTPWFYSTNTLTLDAKGFDIHDIKIKGSENSLKYAYDELQLVIDLGKTYTRKDTFVLEVSYTAKPDERKNIGGSSAISSDKGLYFINADGSDPNKPQQIWTQGETESNSCWFPTIDKPNERCTQEMYITVEDRFKTLSNGVLVASTPNEDGTRTDYWKMDKPHAPYLFMMAIGEFAVVKDQWRDIELSYYVEPEYEADARDIFPYTAEMLEFFSNITGYDYPWQKYGQVVVREYVSGAMENTTGVIFGEFVQLHKRELMDNHLTNEKVVAHEMFHHWFGDLLTTENWANLTLNEGFANYSEYLWMEHKYGKAAADEHHMSEQGGYLYSAQDGGHPLIHFGYANREDMFDAHSYNKGGQVLHMLRNYLGDEAFFAGIQRYLENNAYSDVEAHELRLAFEDVTGQDLNWFFNQWFFAAGHPQLNVNTGYDASKGQAFIEMEQIQEGEEVPAIFNLPLTARIYYADGSFKDHKIRMTKRNQRFTFNAESKPAFISYDASRSLLAQVKDQHSADEYRFILQHGSQFRDRFDAVSYLSESEEDETELMMRALQDESRLIRMVAMSTLDPTDVQAQTVLKKLAANDPEPDVKAQAFAMLGESENKDLIPLITTGLKDDQAYSVVGAALSALMKLDETAALDASKALENATSPALISALSRMYSNNPRPEFQTWFVKQTEKADFMNAFTLFEAHQKYLVGLGNDQFIAESLDKWEAISMDFDKSSAYRRFASTKAMSETRKYYREVGDMVKANEVDKRIKAILASEPDPTLQLYYGMFE